MNGKGLLNGIKVLDLTRVLAGPYCSMMLADMGADVIKIEIPGKGDDSRQNYPIVNGESGYFANINRNKRSLTLNLKSASGKEIFRKLVKNSDIVLENYRPGVMDKLGLGYEDLKKINPGIIYGCISGFGQFGPYSDRAGYDIIGQAMSGLMTTTGWPGGEPTRTGTAIADVFAGASCCIGVLAALSHRLMTGEGEKVDVALVDSMVSSLEIINVIYLLTGRVPEQIGNRYESLYPYDSFKCADGYCVIGAGNDKLFRLLCAEMGQPELAEDERFLKNSDRVANHALLRPLIEVWTGGLTVDEVCRRLLAAGVPVSPINTIDKVVSDHHIADVRGMFVDCDHPVLGKIKITGNQIKLTNNAIREFRPAPALGQHNGEILVGELGLSDVEIAELEESRAI